MENIKKHLTVESIGVIAALLTLIFGVYQYTVSEKWKRSRFAATQLERLYNDEVLKLASSATEWRKRSFPTPEKYKEMYRSNVFNHSSETLKSALSSEFVHGEFKEDEQIYQDLFDYYFNYLERVNHYINIELFEIEDVESLCYWVEKISKPKDYYNEAFSSYIEAYDFDGVVELIDKCQRLN